MQGDCYEIDQLLKSLMFFNRSNRYFGVCFSPSRMFLGLWLGTMAFLILSSNQRTALADAEARVVLEVPVYGQNFSTSNVLPEAETLARDAINQQFSQNPNLTAVRVVVMASRNGEVLPILEASVSRDQWQERADIRSWASYFQASYALLSRNDNQQTTDVANANLNQGVADQASDTLRMAQLDAAIDSCRLSGVQIQRVLDEVD